MKESYFRRHTRLIKYCIGTFVLCLVVVVSGCSKSNPQLKKCIATAEERYDACRIKVEQTVKNESLKNIEIALCKEDRAILKYNCEVKYGQ